MTISIQIKPKDKVLSLHAILEGLKGKVHTPIELKKQTQVNDLTRRSGAIIFPKQCTIPEMLQLIEDRAKAASGIDEGYLRTEFVLPTTLEIQL